MVPWAPLCRWLISTGEFLPQPLRGIACSMLDGMLCSKSGRVLVLEACSLGKLGVWLAG